MRPSAKCMPSTPPNYIADIILLNGASSAGKTAVARFLQEKLEHPFVRLDVDDFVGMFPPQYQGQGKNARNGIDQSEPFSQNSLVRLGPHGKAFLSGFHHCAAAFANQGNKLIIVHLFLEREWLLECARVLKNFRILFVGMNCDLPVVEAREHKRGDRTPGFARSHWELVHGNQQYDLIVDSTRQSVDECSEIILRRLRDATPARALELIRLSGSD